MKNILATVILSLAFTAPVWAKPVDLTPFKGVYNGTAAYLNANASAQGSGAATAVFSTSKNGRTGSLTLSGLIVFQGNTVPLNETLTFGNNGSLGVSDFAPLIVEPQAIFGTYRASKKGTILSASLPWSYMGNTTGLDTFTISVKKTKRTQTLTVTFMLGVNGGPSNFLTITWTATKKIKKS